MHGYQKESAAKAMWYVLTEVDKLPLLWNSFPLHPHETKDTKSNRSPSDIEKQKIGNADMFDADLLINNSGDLKKKIKEFKESKEPSKRELAYVMETCREMYDAGYKFVSDKVKNESFEGFFIENGKPDRN